MDSISIERNHTTSSLNLSDSNNTNSNVHHVHLSSFEPDPIASNEDEEEEENENENDDGGVIALNDDDESEHQQTLNLMNGPNLADDDQQHHNALANLNVMATTSSPSPQNNNETLHQGHRHERQQHHHQQQQHQNYGHRQTNQKRRGSYTERSQEEKLRIGEYAVKFGVTAASNSFKGEDGKIVPLATVSNFKKLFLAGNISKTPGKRGRKTAGRSSGSGNASKKRNNSNENPFSKHSKHSKSVHFGINSTNGLGVDMGITGNQLGSMEQLSWSRNLERNCGFWDDVSWYNLHLTRRLPLVEPMLEEMIAALPPCDGLKVADLGSGSGKATLKLLSAYPSARVTMIESSEQQLTMARSLLDEKYKNTLNYNFIQVAVYPNINALPGAPYDIVLASLALHNIVEKCLRFETTNLPPVSQSQIRKDRPLVIYQQLFGMIFSSLRPGGHLIIADHVGKCPLYIQMKLMDEIGFKDVDCAWRKDDFFVCGGLRE